MKKTTLRIIITLAAMGLLAAACKPKTTVSNANREYRYVGVKDGLNMREEPSQTGKKIMTIRHGAMVQVLETKPETFTIGKTEGKWTKVSYNDKTGWVFGGFLWYSEPSSYESSRSAGVESENPGDSSDEVKKECMANCSSLTPPTECLCFRPGSCSDAQITECDADLGRKKVECENAC